MCDSRWVLAVLLIMFSAGFFNQQMQSNVEDILALVFKVRSLTVIRSATNVSKYTDYAAFPGRVAIRGDWRVCRHVSYGHQYGQLPPAGGSNPSSHTEFILGNAAFMCLWIPFQPRADPAATRQASGSWNPNFHRPHWTPRANTLWVSSSGSCSSCRHSGDGAVAVLSLSHSRSKHTT